MAGGNQGVLVVLGGSGMRSCGGRGRRGCAGVGREEGGRVEVVRGVLLGRRGRGRFCVRWARRGG